MFRDMILKNKKSKKNQSPLGNGAPIPREQVGKFPECILHENTGATNLQIVCLLALPYGKSLRVVFEVG